MITSAGNTTKRQRDVNVNIRLQSRTNLGVSYAQVAEIFAVQEKMVSGWLNKGLLWGPELPGLGQIIDEKELEDYLAKKRKRS